MAFINGSFETIGTSEGKALGWTIAYNTGAQAIATFEGSVVPFETFGVGWSGGNQLSLVEFTDADLLAAYFNDNVLDTIERFDYEWKRPNRMVQLTLSNAGRTAPAFANPSDAFTVGKTYRDRGTGSRAVVNRIVSTTIAEFVYVDFVSPTYIKNEGFANGGLPGVDNVMAELNASKRTIGIGNGHTRTYLYTVPNTPIHAKYVTQPSSIRITAVFGGIEAVSTDDGSGNIIGGNVRTGAINTLNYTTGALVLNFDTAPDADSRIEISYEYGAGATDITSATGAPEPHITTVTFLEPSAVEIPPYNHTAISTFVPANLDDWLDTFESGWDNNQNAILEFAVSNLTIGTLDSGAENYENFENSWSGSNENSVTTFTPLNLSTATFDIALAPYEDFQNEWTTLLQI